MTELHLNRQRTESYIPAFIETRYIHSEP